MYYGTRQLAFEAAHKLKCNKLDKDENKAVYGKEVNIHGHNYILWITLTGTLDPKSSMIVDLGDIDDILKEHVISRFDHKDFSNFFYLPTHENLTIELWKIIREHVPLVSQIRFFETPTLWTDYTGNENNEIYLTEVYEFSSARHITNNNLSEEANKGLFGKWNNLHGHNFKLEVTVKGLMNPETHLLIIRKTFREIVFKIIEKMDYNILNKVSFLKGNILTSENVVRLIWNELIKSFSNSPQGFVGNIGMMFPFEDPAEKIALEDFKEGVEGQYSYEKKQMLWFPKLYKVNLIENEQNSFAYYGSEK